MDRTLAYNQNLEDSDSSDDDAVPKFSAKLASFRNMVTVIRAFRNPTDPLEPIAGPSQAYSPFAEPLRSVVQPRIDPESVKPPFVDLDPLNDIFSTGGISIAQPMETTLRPLTNLQNRRFCRRAMNDPYSVDKKKKLLKIQDDGKRYTQVNIPNEIWDNVGLLQSYCEIENEKLQDYFQQNAERNETP